ncbi:hypothetical protein L2Y94_09090 [Luteibacter aegosomatis]|uniref:lipase family protein n=1 Tax=Luteibacter aegosomatis TaxID=2911537 RepID=UPI001FF9E053|nr:hypothetical protein [Luteibacter aegosomatis]UPG87488.1 hypothetical protein L2Y94_09090 [Luteibacter aegosomatis]
MRPSSTQYAFLSQKIYDPLTVDEYVSSDVRHYKVVYTSPPSSVNYKGAVFLDEENSQLIVANKGTEASNIHDIIADMSMGMGAAPTQWPEAARTMRWALDYAERNQISTSNISITGHSLGGALAQLQASMPESAGVHAETFNAYGAMRLAHDPSIHVDPASAQDRITNHRMYHDPVSALATMIGRSVDYMDLADYQRHQQGELATLVEPNAVMNAHGISNFWDKTNNRPGAVFASNYMDKFLHRPLDDVPEGVPLDLAWPRFGHRERAPMSPLAATASTDDIFDHLCKALEHDDDGFMKALRQVGQTQFAQEFHAETARQMDQEDRANALEAQIQQLNEQQQMAQVQQISGPVMRH